MSIQPLRAPGTAVRAGQTAVPTTRRSPARPLAPGQQPMCVVVPELGDGEAAVLVDKLRRRAHSRVVVLTRRAGRAELRTLLAGGLRGAVATVTEQTVPARPAPARPSAPLPELTAREISVLQHVAGGLSNRRVGEELGLSALTVKSHLARISRKLGTGDRAEMVAMAYRGGVLR